MREQIKNIVKGIPGTRTAYSAYTAVHRSARRLSFYVKGGTRHGYKWYNPVLCNAIGEQVPQSDISDHLGIIFHAATEAAPTFMVELGTRGGASTRALLAAASVTEARLLSVDINDCSPIDVPFRDRWHFVKADDVEFGRTGFRNWCHDRSIEPVIDVLFIDTSHEYEHTRQEINTWSQYLSDRGTLILHDTNMGTGTYARYDGSVDIGWDNRRGVMRALEEFVGRQYDENSFFSDVTDKHSVIHFPNCNGLTIVKKRGGHS
jgi:predicted O-methyltransferase YrrM